MTKEEAWRSAKGYLYDALSGEEADEIIKALEQEPTDTWNIKNVADTLARHGLIVEQEPCEDAISRQAVLDLIADYDLSMGQVVRGVHALQSVKPQEPKTGHWKVIPCGNNHGEYRPPKYMCSECGWEIDLCRGLQQDTGHRLFCEHCGANMVEP